MQKLGGEYLEEFRDGRTRKKSSKIPFWVKAVIFWVSKDSVGRYSFRATGLDVHLLQKQIYCSGILHRAVSSVTNNSNQGQRYDPAYRPIFHSL